MECKKCGQLIHWIIEWEDILDKDMKEISHLDSDKYLGQVLSSDSKNSENITKLRIKGIAGIKTKIVNILTNIPGGLIHFETALIFRSAYYLEFGLIPIAYLIKMRKQMFFPSHPSTK